MKLRVEVVHNAGAPTVHHEFEQGPVTIGRSAKCQIVLEGQAVSRTHLLLDEAHGAWHATHQGSATPTVLNDSPLPLNRPTRVSDGDVLRISDWEIHLAVVSNETVLPSLRPLSDTFVGADKTQAAAAAAPAWSPEPPPPPPAPPPQAPVRAAPPAAAPAPAVLSPFVAHGASGQDVPTLVVVSGGDGGEAGPRLELREPGRTYVLGRASTCDLTLAHTSVSRQHAFVRFDGQRVYVRDAGARNPILLNGRAMVGETPVSNGDVLGFGPLEVRVISGAGAAAAPPAIDSSRTEYLGAAPVGDRTAWVPPSPSPSPSHEPAWSPPPPAATPGWQQHDAPAGGPAWDAEPAGAPAWSPEGGAPPAFGEQAAAPAWEAPSAPPPPPPPTAPAAPSWAPPPLPAAPAAPSWSPPPMMQAPAMHAPAPPPPPAVPSWSPPPVSPPAPPPPPAVPMMTPPAMAIPTPAMPAPAAPAAPPAPGAGETRVVVRRSATGKGWLIAGVIAMSLAVVIGLIFLIAAL